MMMNPQHYYQYQMSAPPRIQVIGNSVQAPCVTADAATTDGMHFGMHPPLPPGALLTTSKTMIPPLPESFDTAPVSPLVGVETPENLVPHDGFDAETLDKAVSEAEETVKSLSSSASSDSPATAFPPINQLSSRSQYAGASIQPTLAQPPATISSLPSGPVQYALAPGVSPFSVAQTPRRVYLTSSIPNTGTGGHCYLPQGGLSPSAVLTNQSGKHVIVGSPAQMPVQYQLAVPAGIKPALPQQYVLAPSSYYNSIQGQHPSALQTVYSPVQGLPIAQNVMGFGTLAQNPSMSGSHVYYYQY